MSEPLNPQFVPTLLRLGRSTADDPTNRHPKTGKPAFVECGVCCAMHPINFHGECRDNDNRLNADELDETYGTDGWTEVYVDEDGEEDGYSE